VALIKGLLLSFDDPLLGVVPTVVPFQYNPTEIQRVFRSEGTGAAAQGERSGAALNAAVPPVEDYTLKLELDATDGLERGGPITLANGIAPRLAALEVMMQPVGKSLLGGLLTGGNVTIPATKLRLVLLAWGPLRVTPVRLTALTIRETAFDELLNPIHATADVGLRVLRLADLGEDERFARAAASYYQGLREVRAVLQIPQTAELI
jgi:hypothetical protein